LLQLLRRQLAAAWFAFFPIPIALPDAPEASFLRQSGGKPPQSKQADEGVLDPSLQGDGRAEVLWGREITSSDRLWPSPGRALVFPRPSRPATRPSHPSRRHPETNYPPVADLRNPTLGSRPRYPCRRRPETNHLPVAELRNPTLGSWIYAARRSGRGSRRLPLPARPRRLISVGRQRV